MYGKVVLLLKYQISACLLNMSYMFAHLTCLDKPLFKKDGIFTHFIIKNFKLQYP